VEGREPFGGPISLRLGEILRSVGPELATHVRVEEISESPHAAGSAPKKAKESRKD
jgi:hypothetical protein